ncbi:MAG: hypothetical protein ACXVXS_07480 [Blastococcus sp.]
MQSEGAWIASALRPDGVGSLVPPVFEAYARVFHPALRYDGDDDVEVSWAEVAAVNGTVDHPRMQWPAVTGAWEYLSSDSQSPTWDGAPAEGHLPADVAARLAAVLTAHTATPGDCWFGVWAGFGFDVPGPTLALPRDRDVVLVQGAVADAARNLAPEPQEQSANLWWPGDRAWCVATDIDLLSSYVGGSRACIEALLDVPELEVWQVDPADPAGLRDDHVNPTPPGGP